MTGVQKLLAAVPLLFLFFPASGSTLDSTGPGWQTLSAGRLTVRYSGSSDILARQVLDKAGRFLDETSVFFGLEAIGPYDIVIAGSREQFLELQPASRPAPEWAGALTYPGLGLVLIMTPGAMEAGGTRYWSLLRHEMAHLLLGDAEIAGHTRLPLWFQEGLATYVAGEMTLPRLFHLGWAQVSGAAPAFAELESAFPRQPALAEAAYARSYLFIRYLTREFGDDSVARLLNGSMELGGLGEGAREAFGLSLAQILRGFERYAKFRAAWLPAIFSTASVWGLITFLFLFTTYRKRVASAKKLKQWDDEEIMLTGAAVSGTAFGTPGGREEEDENKRTLH
ncbi:MAG: peptidase MA family metallohydrolase [bacterium]|nr:peptidase MA family metallohydrolase [bacterium]